MALEWILAKKGKSMKREQKNIVGIVYDGFDESKEENWAVHRMLLKNLESIYTEMNKKTDESFMIEIDFTSKLPDLVLTRLKFRLKHKATSKFPELLEAFGAVLEENTLDWKKEKGEMYMNIQKTREEK